MTSTLIKGALVWGKGETDVLVSGKRISAIGKDIREQPDHIVDAHGQLLTPGLINTHHHLAQSLLKGIPAGINLDLNGWLGAVPYAYWPHFSPECMYTAACTGFAELLRAGCTTCADHHYLYHKTTTPALEEAVFQAAADTGIRLVFCRGGATSADSHRGLQLSGIEPETLDLYLQRLETTVQRFHDPAPDAMTRVVVAPTSIAHTSPPEHLREFVDFARQRGLLLHSHLLEVLFDEEVCQLKYGMSAIDYANENGWLGEDVWFAHMVHADAQAIARLGASGTGIAHCPVSNARLGSGISPIPALAEAGARISIAVDGSGSAESGSMINELMQCWLLHRTRDGADATDVDTVMQWATRGGADILGFPELGQIEPGMLADLCLYDLNAPRFYGLFEPQWAPVICGEPITATHVMINGQWRLRDGEFTGLNLQQLRADSQRQMQQLRALH